MLGVFGIKQIACNQLRIFLLGLADGDISMILGVEDLALCLAEVDIVKICDLLNLLNDVCWLRNLARLCFEIS